MSDYIPFKLPKDLLLGCATAATQIEGGDKNNSWYEWSAQGKIKENGTTLRANNHWELYEDDVKLMAQMGMECYRLGVEWSRIEPSRGEFKSEAIAHYRRELELLLKYNIRPLLTLHHFSNPLWFEKMGAFTSPESVKIFTEFVHYVVENVKDLCQDYVTINEPNVYVTNGYVFGVWPPAEKSIWKGMRVFKYMALSHISAYKEIHQICENAKVGFANHLRIFVPYGSKNLFEILSAKLMRYLFQGAITKSMATGKLQFPIGVTAPLGKGKYYDFIGINYYTRSAVRRLTNSVLPNRPVNDLGWDIYPEGLTQLVKDQYEKYKAPVWITENGTCDKKDSFRADYIYNHLKQIADNNLPVERYYHWTFMDNFEWLEGETAPFGLVKCDFETQKRTVRKSGEFYSEIIKEKQVSQEMIDQYLK
jgi:beta-glucosidase